MQSVFIIGDAKSGTTALYSLIKNSMKKGLFVYEPSTKAQFAFIKNSTEQNIVVKCLYERIRSDVSHLDFFSKNIQVIRDPRDMLVSLLLYIPLLGGRYHNDEYIRDFTALIAKKEEKPSSVSILELFGFLENAGYKGKINLRFSSLLDTSKFYSSSLSNCLSYKYEDFLNNKLFELEKHLESSLENNSKLSAHLSYNARQKKMGAWKSWFTPDDITHFKPLLEEYLDHYNYDTSWNLDPSPTLNPRYGSLYVRDTVTRLKRLPNQFGHLKSKDFYTAEYFSHLESAAEDGAEGAMLELALATLASYQNTPTPEGSFSHQLEKAAARNNPLALIYKGVALESKIIKSQNNLNPADLYTESAKQIGNPKCKRWMERARNEIKRISDL